MSLILKITSADGETATLTLPNPVIKRPSAIKVIPPSRRIKLTGNIPKVVHQIERVGITIFEPSVPL